tara:strand:- start:212 stop:562 length:351 start_codon:yes stop_codon:yes gene_type:complete
MLSVTFDNFELEIETTWMENCDLGFDRVVVLVVSGMSATDLTELLSSNFQQQMHKKSIDKITAEIGLMHGTDYIFQEHATLQTRNLALALSLHQRIVIRLQQEEHFAMLKLHYNGN